MACGELAAGVMIGCLLTGAIVGTILTMVAAPELARVLRGRGAQREREHADQQPDGDDRQRDRHR